MGTQSQRMKAVVFHEDLKQGEICSSRDADRKKPKYWFTGVPRDFRLPAKRPTEEYKLKARTTSEEEEEENEAKIVGMKALLEGFANFTTSQGITHVFFSRGIIKRLAWVILTIAALIFVGVHLWYLIDGYTSFSVTTNVDIIEARSLKFPAVTICNQNAIKRSELLDEIKIISDRRRAKRLNGSDTRNSKEGTRLEISEAVSVFMPAKKIKLGYSKEEMIIFCSFKGENCDMDDFYAFFDSIYGNCYTYNSGKVDNIAAQNTSVAGVTYGLSLILNIDENEYVPSLASEAGVRVVIHDQNSMPFPNHDGVSAAPGLSNNIAVRKTVINRLNRKNYGVCTAPGATDNNMYAEPYKVKYTQWACLMTCYQKQLVKQCHCYNPDAPYDADSSVFRGIGAVTRPCKALNDKDKQCMASVEEEFINRNLSCTHCPAACREIRYDNFLSTSLFPSTNYLEDFVEELNVTNPELLKTLKHEYTNFDKNRKEIIMSNFVKLNVFYQSMSYTSYTQLPSYDDFQFVSDLGGAFGLWIGWSMLTIFEFFWFMIDILVYCFHKKQPQKKMKSIGCCKT